MPSAPSSGSTHRANLVLVGFLAIAAYFLLSEHRAHLMGAWPLLLVLACVVMHVFMHGAHGGGHGHDDNSGGSGHA